METVQFKTNIKCSGCVAKATPFLNEAAGEDNWEVDVNNPDKLLTVSKDEVKIAEIKQAVEKAGFTAVEIA
ncbi:MAG: heavy-metal-associated domain-containing protein [Chitinophagaceae bacterium]|nr:heavy-metal-associated domain-containing protein [Chitinophagaceae bacterium]